MNSTSKNSVLVTGGCGFIGSHMVKRLIDEGHRPLVVDDLSTGYRDALPEGLLVEGNCGDPALIRMVLENHQVDAVIHFAGSIAVGESVTSPSKYYRNNVVNTLELLSTLVQVRPVPVIFSSTAAIFGNPQQVKIDETHERRPVNPYGASKLMVEQILQDFDRAYGMRSISLRYFNAAGADPSGTIGERHVPETHLIPLAIDAALTEQRPLTIFGNDYDTPDGTCIRDYVHVCDLADAHMLALQALWNGHPSDAFNLGNGAGFSVQDVIAAVEGVVGKRVKAEIGPRRAGDAERLVADSSKAREILGWVPRFAELQKIVEHAWQYQKQHRRKLT